MTRIPEFGWKTDCPQPASRYLDSVLLREIGAITPGMRILDLGCGNGSFAARLCAAGATVVGIDASPNGIDRARERNLRGARFERLLIDEGTLDHLREEPFDLVVSSEVVEHLYAPREWAAVCHGALRPGGRVVASTPYHGFLKNMLIVLTNKWPTHFNPLWDGGHVKFWTPTSLRILLEEIGFHQFHWTGAGRAPLLWMSMVASARKPG